MIQPHLIFDHQTSLPLLNGPRSLTASPTSTTEMKDFKEFDEEFRLTKRREGFPPPATRLHQAGVLTAQDTEDI